jgi:succinate dehydrogenase / fumarate reductase iron-sulfur subunit
LGGRSRGGGGVSGVWIRVRRQDAPDRPESRRFEDFEVEVAAGDSIASILYALRERPLTREGRRVAPVAFDSACRGAGCGSCTLLVNGRVRVACRTPIEAVRSKRGPTVLEPLSKLPLVRDLIVDKSPMREHLLSVRAFIGPKLGPAPAGSAELDRCVECGACLEACPETGQDRAFVGAAALNEAHLLDQLESGGRRARLDAVMRGGGVAECGKARNCVDVCPESMPLFDSILGLSHDTARLWLGFLLRR